MKHSDPVDQFFADYQRKLVHARLKQMTPEYRAKPWKLRMIVIIGLVIWFWWGFAKALCG